MKRPFRLIAFSSVLVAFGSLLGMPAGYYLASQNADALPPAPANSDTIKLTLPKTFFADLPTSGNGDQRLVSVDTFNNPYLGSVVLPTFPQQPTAVGPRQLPPLQH